LAKKSLTTREVAQLIGVGEATVKRWAEKSVLHSERTLGGHRRFRLEDVARFQRASSLGGRRRADGRLRIAAASEQVDGASPGTTSLAVFRALVAGQEHEVAALLIGAHLTGASLGAVFDDVLCAAMRRVGDLWYAGDLSVDQEHLATRTALNAINLLKVIIDLPESSTHRAICCCVEEDFHELPVHLTQLILESNDWKVLNLGGNTPFFALAEALARHSPELVCVSAAVLNNPDRAAREYQGLRAAAMRSGATILLGGQVFGGERIRSRFPADYYGDSFRDLANLLGQWSATHCADAVS
jgi:excisionase family DNA binding protein